MTEWPTGNYGTILADPPWLFGTYSEKGRGRCADRHYPCMDFGDIQALPVKSSAARNCVLFMWVTDPFLAHGIRLIERWGFAYKTVAFTWIKQNRTNERFFMGGGFWTRSNPEMCLLATTGSPKRQATDVRQLVTAERREHSRKPDCIYGRIERLVDGPYLELFARTSRDGWTGWGNEVGKFAEVKGQ